MLMVAWSIDSHITRVYEDSQNYLGSYVLDHSSEIL